ncbi:hypothetical protein AVEN_162643-1 [Araneus ventricosus]|uniref:Uncharacterized protein n=1 Tax=Araneus ventricosus TaxID=182803 RepID=A0A4Y2FHQ6_ARAVE|nr:hypothetical protein AVEN_162643-1 [Araneus ventricosus]
MIPCDVTAYHLDHRDVDRLERLWSFVCSASWKASELSAVESDVTVIASELLSVCVANLYKRRGACFTNLLQDERGVRRAVSRTVHHIPVVGRVNIKDSPRPGLAHVVTNSATISDVNELTRQNRRISSREIAVELWINKGTVHHIIHKKLGYGKVCAQWVPKHLSENQKTARMGVCLTHQLLH